MHPPKVIADINDSIFGAKIHFDMWWALAGEARGELKQTMNKHADYFVGVWDAHYTSFYVYFGNLFDRRKDSSSIPTYLTIMQRKFGAVDTKPFRVEFEALAGRAEPLLMARHKTIAHIDANQTEKDIFKELDFTWSEVQLVLADTIAFVAKLQGFSTASDLRIPPEGRIREATFKVLRKLGEA